MLIAGLGLVLVALEQHVRTLGELAGQAGVAGLVHQELLIAAGRGLGVQGELLVAAVGIVAEQVPVAAVHGFLHFLLAVHHAALDGVHLAGAVADDAIVPANPFFSLLLSSCIFITPLLIVLYQYKTLSINNLFDFL